MPQRTVAFPLTRETRTALAIVLALGCTGLALGCASSQPPRPRAAYQADVAIHVIDEEGLKQPLGRLVEFYSTGKLRRETRIDGRAVALIDRPDLGVTWRLELEKDSFEEFPIASPEATLAAIPNPFARGGGEFSFVGREKINGAIVNHYRVKRVGLWGEAWLSTEQVPLRFKGHIGEPGKSLQLLINYEGILLGAVDPDLFVIPTYYAGYRDRTTKEDLTAPPSSDQMQRLDEERRAVPDTTIMSF